MLNENPALCYPAPMVRPESRTPLAEEGFARVVAGEPSSRPRLRQEISAASAGRQKGLRAVFWMGLIACLFPASLAAQESIEDEAVRYFREYLRIDTSNPPGHTLRAAQFLKRILDQEKIPSVWYESVPGSRVNLLARLKAEPTTPAKKPLLLLHHMDVVPAEPSRWPVDPFGGVLKDGHLWGRGAMDMKGHGILHLMTFIQLQRSQVRLDRDVIFLAVADEEIGGGMGASWMIQNHWDELDPEYVLDEGGAGFVGLLSRDKTVFGISVTEKQVLWLRLSAEGTAGHGSQPIEDNANSILLAALTKVLSPSQSPGELPVLREMRRQIGTFADNKFTRAIQRNTISLTTLRAGVGEPAKINVIPSVSTATLDCRLLPGQDPQQFTQKIRTTINDPRVKIEVAYRSVVKETSPHDAPLYKTMESTLRKHFPDALVTPMIVPYGTDSAEFRIQGCKAYGFLPVIVTPEIIGSMHSDSERIPVEGFKKGVRIFYDMIAAFVAK